MIPASRWIRTFLSRIGWALVHLDLILQRNSSWAGVRLADGVSSL